MLVHKTDPYLGNYVAALGRPRVAHSSDGSWTEAPDFFVFGSDLSGYRTKSLPKGTEFPAPLEIDPAMMLPVTCFAYDTPTGVVEVTPDNPVDTDDQKATAVHQIHCYECWRSYVAVTNQPLQGEKVINANEFCDGCGEPLAWGSWDDDETTPTANRGYREWSAPFAVSKFAAAQINIAQALANGKASMPRYYF